MMATPLILSPIPVLLKTEEGLVPERPNLRLDDVVGAPKARMAGGLIAPKQRPSSGLYFEELGAIKIVEAIKEL